MSRIVVGVTGATGAIYALRTLRALLLNGHRVELVVSKFGALTLREELGFSGTFEDYLRSLFPGDLHVHNYLDQTAAIASGSGGVDGMVVVPCTMKTLACIAHGHSTNLIERSADVILKEKRPLVLVPREAPYNLIHLRNMVAAAEAGATILPASPAFYQHPKSFDDLGDFIAARALNFFGIRLPLFTPWQGLERDE
jgi:flavin prenyltransferase